MSDQRDPARPLVASFFCKRKKEREKENPIVCVVVVAGFSVSIQTPTWTPTGWLIHSQIRSRTKSITCCLEWMAADLTSGRNEGWRREEAEQGAKEG